MTETKTVTISLLAGSALSGNRESRRSQLANAIGEAPDADVLVLPYLGSYPPFWSAIDRASGFAFGERSPFLTIKAIERAVADRGIPTLATVYQVVAEGVFYATAVMVETDGTSRAIHRQEHASNEPAWHERLFFQPGVNETPALLDVGGLRVGFLMGGDLMVPEAARRLRLAGAEAIVVVTGTPDSFAGSGSLLAGSRAIENGVPVVWSTQATVDLAAPAPGLATLEKTGEWRAVTLDASAIRSSLQRNDPLQSRRPRLYYSLIDTWREGAE